MHQLYFIYWHTELTSNKICSERWGTAEQDNVCGCVAESCWALTQGFPALAAWLELPGQMFPTAIWGKEQWVKFQPLVIKMSTRSLGRNLIVLSLSEGFSNPCKICILDSRENSLLILAAWCVISSAGIWHLIYRNYLLFSSGILIKKTYVRPEGASPEVQRSTKPGQK